MPEKVAGVTADSFVTFELCQTSKLFSTISNDTTSSARVVAVTATLAIGSGSQANGTKAMAASGG